MASVPDFTWTAFYYPEILRALIQLKATSWPEHTEEDPHDPVVQMYQMFSAVGHGQSCRLDHTARELYITTLQLRSSMIPLAFLMDYTLDPPVPAEGDLVAQLSGTATAGVVLVRAHSGFATDGVEADPSVAFEYDEDDDLLATKDSGTYLVWEDDGGVLTEITAGPAALWGGVPVVNDALYIGHPDLMFGSMTLALTVAGANIDRGRWEYYDPERSDTPNSITDLGGSIRAIVDTLLGGLPAENADGNQVTITCTLTGVSETVAVTHTGVANKIETAGTLGQTTVSTSAADYVIATDWPTVPSLVDATGTAATAQLTSGGDVTWAIPQTTALDWSKGQPDSAMQTAHWIRFRVTELGGSPTAPTLTALPTEPRKTVWAIKIPVRQGKRKEEKLGTTDGSAGQWFNLGFAPFMELREVNVGGSTWARVASFLASSSADRHFTLLEQADGAWRLKFGDGTTGTIPTLGSAVRVRYRVGGATSGNVGPGAVDKDRSGNARLKAWANPRSLTGWIVQEGTTAASLDITRLKIPATMRTRGRAVTPADAEALSLEFTAADGSVPVVRALAIEEGNGPKTMALVCVGPGGIAPSTSDLAELGVYHNGTPVGLQRHGGVGLANTETTPEAYTPQAIDVTVTVSVLSDYASGAKERTEAALGAILTPIARRQVTNANGEWETSTTYLWDWDGEVARALLFSAIATALDGVTNVALAVPAADVPLVSRSLPVQGTVAVTIVSV